MLLTFPVNEKLPVHTVSHTLSKKSPNPRVVYFKTRDNCCVQITCLFISGFFGGLFVSSGGADPSIDDFSLFCNKLMKRRDYSRVFEVWPWEFVLILFNLSS